MSKDIKDLIDSAEEDLKSRLELEKTVEKLHNENISLKNEIMAQKSLIEQNDNITKSKTSDTDIQILKDMLVSQRENLVIKDSKIEALEYKIDDLSSELKKDQNIIDELKDTEVLENAYATIDALIEEKSKLENQIAGLNKKIADLGEENESLLQNIDTVKADQETFDNFNIEIDNLKNEIISLEKVNTLLRKNITELEEKYKTLSYDTKKMETAKEYITRLEDKVAELSDKIEGLNGIISDLEEKNEALLETRGTPTADQPVISKLENNIIRLQKRVAELEKENKEYFEKNQVLKAALLLHVDVESKHITPDANVMEDERIISIPKGIVQERIKAREQAVEEREKPGKITPKDLKIESEKIEEPTIELEISPLSDYETSKISEASENIKTNEPFGTEELLETSVPATNQINEIELEQEQEELINEPSIERRKCPECGNTNKLLIREILDKTIIISADAGLYGKKYMCGKCGAEWR